MIFLRIYFASGSKYKMLAIYERVNFIFKMSAPMSMRFLMKLNQGKSIFL